MNRYSIKSSPSELFSPRSEGDADTVTYRRKLRDRALVEFFYATGCRLNEVIHLKVENLDLDGRTALIDLVSRLDTQYRGRGYTTKGMASASKPAQAARALGEARGRRHMMIGKNRWPETITVLGVGVAVGAILGVLFAPNSGKETREYITDTAQEGVDAVVSRGQKFISRAQKTVIQAKEQVQDAADAGERAFDQASRRSEHQIRSNL